MNTQATETTGMDSPIESTSTPFSKLFILRSVLYTWSIIPLLTVFFASAVVTCLPVALLFDRKRNILHHIATRWAKSIVLFNPWWKFVMEGEENLPAGDEAVVYVANHQSQADILVVYLIGRQFRWLAKDSLFKVPFLGWAMSAAGYVRVKRGDRRSHVECMRRSAAHLKAGTSMLFFPEGTRSKDSRLQVFKGGAFKLAKETNVAVVPITIQGATRLLPKGSIVPSAARVVITVHPKIDSGPLTVEEIMQTAREFIRTKLESALSSETID
jgi:1-acyl-sn-glycerol-3-phosphate acyltransferase